MTAEQYINKEKQDNILILLIYTFYKTEYKYSLNAYKIYKYSLVMDFCGIKACNLLLKKRGKHKNKVDRYFFDNLCKKKKNPEISLKK